MMTIFLNTVDCELTSSVDTEAHFGTIVIEFRIRNEDECLHYCLHKVKWLILIANCSSLVMMCKHSNRNKD